MDDMDYLFIATFNKTVSSETKNNTKTFFRKDTQRLV